MDRHDRSKTATVAGCIHCRQPLHLPPGNSCVRCSACRGVTFLTGHHHDAPPPPQPPPAHTLTTPTFPDAAGVFQRYHPQAPRFFPPQPAQGPHQLSFPIPAPPVGRTPVTPTMFPAPMTCQTGRKKALICGISYKGTRYELKGCYNDAECMKYLLVHKFNFHESNIFTLTEEENDPNKIPTKKNIRSGLHWLVEGCRPGDSLVFHYSGHGAQQRDTDGDEVDGFDETLCPLDFQQRGMIVDDEINDVIVKPLPPGVRLHAIIDACHSGTVLDLPFLCRMRRSGQYEWEDHRPRTGVWKGTNGGEVISFSGCDDDQISADTSALSKTTSTGAMTYALIQAVERGEATTYGNLLNSMRSAVRNAGQGGTVTTLITNLLVGRDPRFTQEPQLTSNERFDVYKKKFTL